MQSRNTPERFIGCKGTTFYNVDHIVSNPEKDGQQKCKLKLVFYCII